MSRIRRKKTEALQCGEPAGDLGAGGSLVSTPLAPLGHINHNDPGHPEHGGRLRGVRLNPGVIAWPKG